VPGDVEVDADIGRYAELRRTSGEDFSVAEPLQYWVDVVVSGVPVDAPTDETATPDVTSGLPGASRPASLPL